MIARLPADPAVNGQEIGAEAYWDWFLSASSLESETHADFTWFPMGARRGQGTPWGVKYQVRDLVFGMILPAE